MKKLSLIVPVYNEEKIVKAAIERVLDTKITGVETEVIVINDGSIDNTKKELEKIKDKRVKIYHHRVNQGKGAAMRTGFSKISGDIAVVQDADLEYDPVDLNLMVAPILDGRADVVYGSRFMGSGPHRVHYFWHMVGNQFFTLLSNMLTNINLTDMETGYKMMTAEVVKKIDLKENRFGFDPEITAKIAKMRARVYEVGISYAGRSYEEGKKINWKDGVRSVYCILKYNLS